MRLAFILSKKRINRLVPKTTLMRNSLFFFFFIAIIGVAIWYLSRRTAFIFSCKAWPFILIYTLLLTGSFFFTFAAVREWTCRPLPHALVCIFSEMMGVLLYLLLFMLLTDLMQLFAHWAPKTFGAIVFSLTALVCTGATINAFLPRLKPVTIELPKLQKPMRAVLLTDTHLGHFRGVRHVQKLVNLINQADPEIVFFTGDCFESHYNLGTKTLEPFKQIKAPIYFVSGNHDGYVDLAQVKQLLRETGIRVLETEVVEEHGLQILGLDYMRIDGSDRNSMHAPVGEATIQSVCDTFQASGELPVIALHHNPSGGHYLEQAGVDLFLGGHTHGGQLIPLIWVNDRLFQFNRGLYHYGKMQAYTSCGTGTFGPPMRLGTRSEITVLKLTPNRQNQHSAWAANHIFSYFCGL